MSWTLLLLLIVGLWTALAVMLSRRAELRRMRCTVAEREDAQERGSHHAQLQYPQVDLSNCLGCASCIRACPEERVLELIHGQAMVIHGARCVGHGLCAKECPTGAIRVELGDLENRRDIPVIDDHFEVVGTPGLFLAGEVTGYALIRTAISHGSTIAAEVSRRLALDPPPPATSPPERAEDDVLDLCIIGAGPAGLACSLEAKARGLSFVTLEQERLGGTVASYPRRKLVMTQPVELPLHGKLTSSTYTKEELMELWERVAREHELPIRSGQVFEGLEREPDGTLRVRVLDAPAVRARNVCLGLGRRGTPRKLGVPGEDLPKVAYSLLDAQSYQGRRVLVVGGGDSAVEAAIGLAAQPGNHVTLSYRKHAFFRIKARNERRLEECVSNGSIQVLFQSRVTAIHNDHVELLARAQGGEQPLRLENDDVFVFAGGVPPFDLLTASGVSFDPGDRAAVTGEAQGLESSGLLRSLAMTCALTLLAAAWILLHRGYYTAPLAQRTMLAEHESLRPAAGIGLALGIAAVVLILCNLSYLLRKSASIPLWVGSLRAWMVSHLVTGVLALLLALLHAAMAPRHTVGGHALLALAALVGTGAIGRYFYSFVPHAANGRELALDEVRSRLAQLSAEWDRGHRGFGERVRHEVQEVAAAEHWESSFFRRVFHLLHAQSRMRAALARIEAEGRAEGLSEEQLQELTQLARRARRESLMAAHFEDVRGLLATWRFLHRWVALLMVLLLTAHVVSAVRFGGLWD